MSGYSWKETDAFKGFASLFGANTKLSFLVSSGISLDPPSCQPTGLQFTQFLISHLIPKEKQASILGLSQSVSFERLGGNRFLRFECLMEHLRRWDKDLDLLNGYGICCLPNHNHKALAYFISDDHAGFTTNFDNLLEQALLDANIPRNRIKPVISRGDWESGNRGQCCVYKLHGSLIDFRTQLDSRKSVQATIRQIAVNKGQMQLEQWKRTVFSEVLEERDLLILGYSGLDDFDVLPKLRAIKSNKRIIWIDHDEAVSIYNAKIQIITKISSEPSQDRVGNFLLSLIEDSRSSQNIIKIRVNTREVLNCLLSQYFADTHVNISDTCCPGFELDFPVKLNLSIAEKWFLAGNINSYFDPIETTEIFGRALAEAKKEKNIELEANCNLYLGRQFETVLYHIDITDTQRKAYWDKAKLCYETLLELCVDRVDISWRQIEAKAYNNIGMLYRYLPGMKNIQKTINYFERALCINEKIADLEGKARDYNNIGAARYALGDLPEAIRNGEQACAIDRQLGDLHHLGVRMANIGQFYCDKHDNKGVEPLKEALEIELQIGSMGAIANCMNSLAYFFSTHGKLQLAIDYYTKGLAFVKNENISLASAMQRSLHAAIANQKGLPMKPELRQLGFKCYCKHEFYFKQEEVRLLTDHMPMILTCSKCQCSIFIARLKDELLTYRITEMRGEGEFLYDSTPISSCVVPE